MSMLSAQCDELRSMAESMGLAMPQAATLMMKAADTITELRGALQVASVDYRHLQAERDKLRTQLADSTESMGRVEERCAKLRELVRDCDMYIVTCDTRTIEGSIKASHDLFELEVRMRELGVME